MVTEKMFLHNSTNTEIKPWFLFLIVQKLSLGCTLNEVELGGCINWEVCVCEGKEGVMSLNILMTIDDWSGKDISEESGGSFLWNPLYLE